MKNEHIDTEHTSKYCSKCGEPLGLEQKFCKKCGKTTTTKPDRAIEVRIPKVGKRSMIIVGIITAALLAISAVIFIGAFAFNFSNSPTRAVKNYLDALKQEQYSAAFSEIDMSRLTLSLNDQIFVSANKAADKKWGKLSSYKIISSMEVKPSGTDSGDGPLPNSLNTRNASPGDTTLVVVTVARGDKAGKNETFYVKRNKTFWLFNSYLVVPPIGTITLDTNVSEGTVSLNGQPVTAIFEKRTDSSNKLAVTVSGLPYGVYKVRLVVTGAKPLDFEGDLDNESFAYAANVEPTPETASAIDASSKAFLAAFLEAAKANDSKLLSKTATSSMVAKAAGELGWHSQETSMTINDRVSCELWSPTTAKAVYTETYVTNYGAGFGYSYNVDNHSKTTYKLLKSGNVWLVDDMQRSSF